MNDLVTSWIRSVVPIIVGAFASWLFARTGFVIDEASQVGLVTAFTGLLSGLYYVVVRWLETKQPQLGWLLGLPKQPGYSDDSVPPPQPAPDDAGEGELSVILLVVQIIFYLVGAIWFINSLGWFD